MARKSLDILCRGIPIDPLPDYNPRDENVIHAPYRQHGLNSDEQKKAVDNALRYFPFGVHNVLRPEFEQELELYGHIYMYRFMPKMDIKAYPFEEYPGNVVEAKAIMLMIMNNLDPQVAQFPQELVTYGSNGQVFSNWAQFLLTMKYLGQMTDSQTLVLSSGHPMGLFPTNPSYCCDANSDEESREVEMFAENKTTTRLIISNGMMVPEYCTKTQHDRLFALGVTMYGQMTAGSFCYIGPQGIVHGTVITLLNVARKYMGSDVDMAGKVFLSSGLGGMSGAQAKASTIVGCIGVIAEVSEEAILKRHEQGWVKEILTEPADCVSRVKEAKLKKESTSIAFHGNIVDLWQAFVQDYLSGGGKTVDFGSDQTSLHNPFNGGYYPQGLSLDQANCMMRDRPREFEEAVKASLRLQVQLINELHNRSGLIFWDYGNAFLLEACRANADVTLPGSPKGIGLNPCFRYFSYVQEIMGDIFALGFGPFRWVCTSGSVADLELTDKLALEVLEKRLSSLEARAQIDKEVALAKIIQLYYDNVIWMRHIIKSSTSKPKLDNEGYLTVGSKARILYSDAVGRMELARAMNKAIAKGQIKWPIVLTRDHHDVSGADSPFRETSDIKDGSSLCADMSVQNILGNVARCATWVAIHNGGGVGWAQVINNGVGIVLDGTPQSLKRALAVLAWDVQNGVSRRCWSNIQSSNYSAYVVRSLMQSDASLKVTIPYQIN